MKRILLTLVAGLVSCTVFGQGGVIINTRGGGVDAKVTDVTGADVAGSAYLAQLYYGAPGVAQSAMVAVLNAAAPGGVTATPANFGTSAATYGYILTSTGGGNRYTDPAVVGPGLQTDFQLRAWNAGLGATWEAALAAAPANPTLSFGFSPVVTIATSANNLDTPKPLVGLQAFTIQPIPEPGVIALGALGLVALLWRRRK